MWPHKEVHQKSLQATHGPQASWQANAQTRWPPNQKLRIQSWLWFSFPGGLIPELSPSQGYEATSTHGHAATCTWADDISAGPQSATTRAKEGMPWPPPPAALLVFLRLGGKGRRQTSLQGHPVHQEPCKGFCWCS